MLVFGEDSSGLALLASVTESITASVDFLGVVLFVLAGCLPLSNEGFHSSASGCSGDFSSSSLDSEFDFSAGDPAGLSADSSSDKIGSVAGFFFFLLFFFFFSPGSSSNVASLIAARRFCYNVRIIKRRLTDNEA